MELVNEVIKADRITDVTTWDENYRDVHFSINIGFHEKSLVYDEELAANIFRHLPLFYFQQSSSYDQRRDNSHACVCEREYT